MGDYPQYGNAMFLVFLRKVYNNRYQILLHLDHLDMEGDNRLADLFTPYNFKNLTLKNRIVMPPMCQYSVQAEDGFRMIGILFITSAVP